MSTLENATKNYHMGRMISRKFFKRTNPDKLAPPLLGAELEVPFEFYGDVLLYSFNTPSALDFVELARIANKLGATAQVDQHAPNNFLIYLDNPVDDQDGFACYGMDANLRIKLKQRYADYPLKPFLEWDSERLRLTSLRNH